jgi:hypothetical protein
MFKVTGLRVRHQKLWPVHCQTRLRSTTAKSRGLEGSNPLRSSSQAGFCATLPSRSRAPLLPSNSKNPQFGIPVEARLTSAILWSGAPYSAVSNSRTINGNVPPLSHRRSAWSQATRTPMGSDSVTLIGAAIPTGYYGLGFPTKASSCRDRSQSAIGAT